MPRPRRPESTLPKYLGVFEFRFNTRNMDDGERVSRAVKRADGKRLAYREHVESA